MPLAVGPLLSGHAMQRELGRSLSSGKQSKWSRCLVKHSFVNKFWIFRSFCCCALSKKRCPSIDACVKLHSAGGGGSFSNPEAALAGMDGRGMFHDAARVFRPKILCAPGMKVVRVLGSHRQSSCSIGRIPSLTQKPLVGKRGGPLSQIQVLNFFSSARTNHPTP